MESGHTTCRRIPPGRGQAVVESRPGGPATSCSQSLPQSSPCRKDRVSVADNQLFSRATPGRSASASTEARHSRVLRSINDALQLCLGRRSAAHVGIGMARPNRRSPSARAFALVSLGCLRPRGLWSRTGARDRTWPSARRDPFTPNEGGTIRGLRRQHGTRIARYYDVCDRMETSSTCRSLFDMDLLRKSLERVRAGEISGALTSPIDRSIDAGLFLLEQEIS